MRLLADECCPKAVVDRLRAARLLSVLADAGFEARGQVTIIEARRVRQRVLDVP